MAKRKKNIYGAIKAAIAIIVICGFIKIITSADIAMVAIFFTLLIGFGGVFLAIVKEYHSDEHKRIADRCVNEELFKPKKYSPTYRSRPKRSLLDELRSKKPTEFETYMADYYKREGYSVQQTPPVGDGGKDIILRKGGHLYYVECKKYSEGVKVGSPEIQKLIGACAPVNAKPIFVTTSQYTKAAIKVARESNVKLIDQYKLIEMINKQKNKKC